MKNLLSASLAFAVFAACANDDVIVNGVHAYTPDGYIVPHEPAVLEKLEWFKDQKLGLMMHFGIYSQLGIYESWPLSDEDESWSREQIDWTDDGEFLKAQYWGMAKSFNPVRFEPEKWADVAARNGFRYVTLTTKHHDGFCMFDSKHSDFKITNTNLCPFATNPRADVVKNVFEAFRARGLGISAYFSKPDWHHPDYWDGYGLGRRVGRWPTYDPLADPARWNRFREFTKNQILELVRDYG
ncbi:MAG: alpha-L-fucosidase, partial [Kiritimatiellae bacterium]|nr:alpha-L-fucosidase [Kiritimatiellia bacterium]